MTLHWNQACATVVKNTFINLEPLAAPTKRTCKSVPASSRLCRQDFVGLGDGKLLAVSVDSDVSTDAQTDASTCSQCGVMTPMTMTPMLTGLEPPPLALDSFCFEEATTSPVSHSWPQEGHSQNPRFTAVSNVQSAHSPEIVSHSRLSSRAIAFQPKVVTQDLAKQPFKRHFEDVLNRAKRAMQESGYVANVEVRLDEDGWSISVQPIEMADGKWQTDRLLTIAKESLLQACSKSKCIYILGYCAPKPFVMRAQGFEATLGAMESARTACWHVYKKGFCRHGASCCKEHPACEMTVRVLVESVQFNSPCHRFQKYFTQQVADLATAVTTTLRECSYADQVEAFVNEDCQGWNIEVTAKEELSSHREYLTTLAKNILFSGTSKSNTLYIMGYAAKPFITKAEGFVTILGDMQDESRACWDLYSKGSCCRECECRWEHPECFMPIKVVFKARPSQKCLHAELESMAARLSSRAMSCASAVAR